MELDLTNPDLWSIDELRSLNERVRIEIDRRTILENAENQAEQLAIDYSKAIGRHTGDVWKQPSGAHNAYPKNMQVKHNNKLWVSLIPSNVWEPGTTGWREVATDENGVPEWIQPLGAHDAYQLGDEVTFEGVVYVSTVDNNVTDPTGNNWVMKYPVIQDRSQPSGSWDAYRLDDLVKYSGDTYKSIVDWNVWVPGIHGWELVEEEPVVNIPSDDEEEEEETPSEPSAPAFVQPTGGHDAYKKGDRVTFNGSVWESKVDANVYSPTDYAANWTKIS